MLKKRFPALLFTLCSLFFATSLPSTNFIQAYEEVEFENKYQFATPRTLGEYITPIVQAAILGAGVIAFLLFLAGGFTMITSAGNPQSQEKGKGAVTAGVAGLILVISAYWIVQIIEFLTGIDILNSGL